MSTLCILLGDQLDHEISALRDLDHAHDRVLMMEVMDEGRYVPHHPKKIAFILSAMRHFAKDLLDEGAQVDYIKLDDPRSLGSFTQTLTNHLETQSFDEIVVTEPSEYRVLREVESWEEILEVPVRILEDDRFLCSKEEFQAWADGKKSPLMENFYRTMRKRLGLLMDGGKPVGGKWNYDKDNRRTPPKGQSFPEPHYVAPDKTTQEILALVEKHFAGHFGDLEPFGFAVTRADALKSLDHFVEHALPYFGDFQDAMREHEYVLFHSLLAQYLNIGLLRPLEICLKVQESFEKQNAPLNAVEGFIRQIIGWREFIRGVYWLHMPAYADRNFFDAERPLPNMYWGGETEMNCVRQVVANTRKYAYSHHIQRLMVTGNLAMLIGIDPVAIHEWYLAVYADAYEWVEMPNTLGMATFADGGVVGTKPYAASGAYINKMSDFCKSCHFDVKQRNGEAACPFNYLYWNFLIKHRNKLERNHRMSLIYRQLDRLPQERQESIVADADGFLAKLD